MKFVVEVEWRDKRDDLAEFYSVNGTCLGFVRMIESGKYRATVLRGVPVPHRPHPTLAEAKRWVEDQVGEPFEPELVGIGMSDKVGMRTHAREVKGDVK